MMGVHKDVRQDAGHLPLPCLLWKLRELLTSWTELAVSLGLVGGLTSLLAQGLHECGKG